MGARNISISDEAYERLKSIKKQGESFTDVINRITCRRSILELADLLSRKEGREMKIAIKEHRRKSRCLSELKVAMDTREVVDRNVYEYFKSKGTAVWPDEAARDLGYSVLEVLNALERLKKKGKA